MTNEDRVSGIEEWFAQVAKGEKFTYCISSSTSDSVFSGRALELFKAGDTYYIGFEDEVTNTVDYFKLDEISFSRMLEAN